MRRRQEERPQAPQSERLKWYRELDQLGRQVGTSPTVELRGRFWDVDPNTISRRVGKISVAIPMGDLTDFEIGECLRALKLQVVNETGLPARPENLGDLDLPARVAKGNES